MNNKNKLTTTIALIMSFMLSLSLTFITILTAIQGTLFQEPFIENILEKTNYYQQTQKNITTNMKYRGQPFGIPDETLENILPLENIKKNINNNLKYNQEKTQNETEINYLKEELQIRLENLIDQEGLELGEAQQAAIDEYIQLATKEYEKGIKLPFLEAYKNISKQYQKALPIALTGLITAATLFIFVLLKLNIKENKKTYFNYSGLATGLMTMTLPAIILHKEAYKRIQLAPQSIYDFITELITTILTVLVLAGLFWITITTINIIYLQIKQNKNIDKTRHKI